MRIDEEYPICGPARGCIGGCFSFWCCCKGLSHLYCPHHASDETVAAATPSAFSFSGPSAV